MSARHPVPRAAFCEDYNEEEQHIVPETRKVANVAAKRSKAELVKPKVSEPRHDPASDSGYSSHTPAMAGSGDVAQAAKAAPVALKLDTAAMSSKRRPTHPEKRSESTQRSPSQPSVHRSESRSRKKDPVRHEHCQCKDCAPRGRSATTPLESPWPLDYYPFTQPRHRNEGPPSPKSARHLQPIYAHEIPVIHTVQPRPRALTAQSTRPPRPVSFHGGVMPEPMYIAPMYVERGPPPSTSAYAHSPSYAPPVYPPPGAAFIPPPAPPSAPPPILQEKYPPPTATYAQPRPQARQWTSEVHPARRSSVYGRPVVDYEEQVYSAPPMERRSSSHRSHREHAPTPTDREYFRDEDYYLMPPPKTVPTQRPPLRHLSTTASNQSHARAASVEARVSDRSRREAAEQSSRSRRPSLATRPSTTSRKSTSYANAPDNAKVSVESARQRRASYYGHERHHDLEVKQREIEEYQEAKGSKSIPLTADALAARKGTRSSDSGSRASGSREGSEVKTRSATGGSGVAAKSDAESFTMRFNAGAGVKVDFAGDSVDGKTISLRPSGADGLMELSVGGRESKKYHASEGKQVEYARSGLRREVKEPEELRRTREDMRSAKSSRRSSRSGYSGRGQVE